MELRHPTGVAGSHPSYTVALSAIGHFLVRERGRGVLIAELGTGFFVSWHDPVHWGRAFHRTVEHHEILDQTGPIQGVLLTIEQAREPTKKRLFRKQQDVFDLTLVDFFQALGARLDRQRAVAITLIEIESGFRVLYWVDKATFVIQGRLRMPISLHHDDSLDRDAIKATIESERVLRNQEFDALEHSLRTSPKDFPTLIAAMANVEGDFRYRDAEDLAVRIATLFPDRDEAHYHAARYAFARGDAAVAATRLLPALRARPPFPEVLGLQARILWATGKRSEALPLWEEAGQADPSIPVHHQRYARALVALGRKEEAAPHIQAAEESTIAPTREMALDILAAESDAARESETPALRRPGDRPSPLTPNDAPANSDLHPFLTGEESRPERARGPLSARLGGSEWEAAPWEQPERQSYTLPLTSSPLPTNSEAPELSGKAESLPPSPDWPMPPTAGSGGSGRLGGRPSAGRVSPTGGAGDSSTEGMEDDEAEIADLNALLAERPDDPALLRRLGFVLARKGQLDAAADVYRKAREVDPGH
ncbi:MAG TPA: tetratricopeptide repeat protein [Chloroflexota bacterium]